MNGLASSFSRSLFAAAIACALLSALPFAVGEAHAGGCRQGKESCGVFEGSCCSGLTCDVLGECRHTPGQNGERCGTGVPCGSGLQCSSPVAGRCQPVPACHTSGQSCGVLGGTCCSGLTCDLIGECRHSPPQAGEPCGGTVTCAAGLACSSPVGGRCEACGQAGDGCGITGGGGGCCSGLVCDIAGECRHDPPELGEPCGTLVPCAGVLECDSLVGGRCIACRQGTESCIGLGRGNCCSGLQCDIAGSCRHVPGELGEACGAGVPCADPLECSAIAGGTCRACGAPGDACFGLGNGTCCDDDGEGNDLVCDFIGECRRSRPHIGEPCGVGVPCAEGYCDATIGGRCAESTGIPCDRLFPDCPAGQVCDFLCGECRERTPTEGQVCGLDDFLGPDCAEGLTCRLALPCSRCDPERGLGQRCFSSTNCVEGLQCWPFEQVCYPEGGEEIFPDALCLAIYSPERHFAASLLGVAVSHGASTSGAVGIGTSVEVGGVYGPDGRYGCYITRCTGGETSVGVSTGACLGVTVDYDSFSGISTVVSEGAGPGTGVQFSTSQVFDPAAGLDFPIGTADCFSLEASISPPLSGGVYQCDTIVDTVLGELTTRAPSGIAGDADGNGRLAATDALLTLKVSVGAGLRCPRCVCDLNGSGTVTVTDALMTLQLAAGLTPPIPLANPACETPDMPVEINAIELERARELLLPVRTSPEVQRVE